MLQHLLQPRLRSFADDDTGAVAPLVALLLGVLLAFCALALDFGNVYAHRRALQNAADAAALAGAREVQLQMVGDSNSDPAYQAAVFASRHDVKVLGPTCPTSGNGTITYNAPDPSTPNSWEVVVSQRVPLVFAPVLGITTQCVEARAIAVVADLQPAKIWPWGQLKGSASSPGTFLWELATYGYNRTFTLKQGSGDSTSGNFDIVDFSCGGGGSTDYDDWIYRGYGSAAGESVPGPIPPTTWGICSEGGNKSTVNKDYARWLADQVRAGCAYGADLRCPTIGLIPIISGTSWPSGTKPITVVDFAVFEITSVSVDNGTGHMTIAGRFLRYAGGIGAIRAPDPNGSLSEAIGVRLWR
jgi:Flp pilus assembly protein TadG